MLTGSDQPLAGKVALITGGGRGIGRAIALAYANAGADIAVVARTQSQLDEVVGAVTSHGRSAIGLACDVTDYDAVKDMASAFRAVFDRLDILVNNAGGNLDQRSILDSDPEVWTGGIELNLYSAYFVSRELLPLMIETGGGKVINMSSNLGRSPGPGVYRVGKAAMWMFTQSLSMEVWQHDIDVNELIPGPVETFLTRGLMKVGETPTFAASERVKPPEDVAPLALWLATQPKGGPTGQSFSIARRPI
ncbi:MAG: SDR family oxidoreductase [Chloroflexi bacterium]|nr:SDR family oxidoreductase [Chloroflexota bacterium]